jgi:hypothetical protein
MYLGKLACRERPTADGGADVIRRWLFSSVLAAMFGADRGWGRRLPGPHQSTFSVGGAVATPATYSLAQLDALPQTTFTVNGRRWRGSRSHTDSGVSLEDLVNAAAPTEPSARNAWLRLAVTVSSRRAGSGTFALGELDSSFGNHPAYLTLLRDGHALRAPELVVPGDVNSAGTVLRSSGLRSPTYSASSTATSRAGATSRSWSTSSSAREFRSIVVGGQAPGAACPRSDAGGARGDSIEPSPEPMSDRWTHLHMRWCTGGAVPGRRLRRGADAHGRYSGGGWSALWPRRACCSAPSSRSR